MIDKDKLKRRFSRHAKTYDKYAVVQKDMGNHLIEIIKGISALRILEVGSGTGYVTRKLTETFPNAHIVAIDIAEGMIKVAKENIRSGQVSFICGDIEEISFDYEFDLIISNATFQWFNHPDTTLLKLRSLLSKNGTLCFSTFGEHTFCELHKCYESIKTDVDVTPGQKFLTKNQLYQLTYKTFKTQKIFVDEKKYTETFDSCLSFFESIKKIGANNSSNKGNAKDPQFLQNVIKHYEENYKLDNQIKATYHGVFVFVNL